MVAMVIISRSFDHSLVVENYYEEDLAYQAHIDRLSNTRALERDLIIQEDKAGQVILLKFPTDFQVLTGDVWFYRPDNKSNDFKIKIEADAEGRFILPSKNLAAGLWKMKIDWEGDGKPFYKEATIII